MRKSATKAQGGASIVPVVLGLAITALASFAALQAFTGARAAQDANTALAELAPLPAKAIAFKRSPSQWGVFTEPVLSPPAINGPFADGAFGGMPAVNVFGKAVEAEVKTTALNELILRYELPSEAACVAASIPAGALSGVRLIDCTGALLTLTIN